MTHAEAAAHSWGLQVNGLDCAELREHASPFTGLVVFIILGVFTLIGVGVARLVFT